jgi:hypothetical protein
LPRRDAGATQSRAAGWANQGGAMTFMTSIFGIAVTAVQRMFLSGIVQFS